MHPSELSDELLQCFDANGHPTEVHTRAEVKRMPPRWWYATARVYLVNDRGELMCSKRAEGLSGNPGKWQTYFGGHVGGGFSIKEAAQKELHEEAGLDRSLEEFSSIDRGQNEEKKMFFENFAVRFNGLPQDLRFTDGEVTEARWMSMEEYNDNQQKHPDCWCNGCPLERQERIRTWLKKSDIRT